MLEDNTTDNNRTFKYSDIVNASEKLKEHIHTNGVGTDFTMPRRTSHVSYISPTENVNMIQIIEYEEDVILKVGDDEIPMKDLINIVKMMKNHPDFSAAFV